MPTIPPAGGLPPRGETTAGGRTLAWLQAVTGQLYLAITVAQLVALSLAEGARPDSASRD